MISLWTWSLSVCYRICRCKSPVVWLIISTSSSQIIISYTRPISSITMYYYSQYIATIIISWSIYRCIYRSIFKYNFSSWHICTWIGKTCFKSMIISSLIVISTNSTIRHTTSCSCLNCSQVSIHHCDTSPTIIWVTYSECIYSWDISPVYIITWIWFCHCPYCCVSWNHIKTLYCSICHKQCGNIESCHSFTKYSCDSIDIFRSPTIQSFWIWTWKCHCRSWCIYIYCPNYSWFISNHIRSRSTIRICSTC